MRRSVPGRLQKYDEAKIAVATQPIQSSMAIPSGGGLRTGRLGSAADSEPIRPNFLPFLQHEAVRSEQGANALRLPGGKLLENRHQNTKRVVAENRAPRDTCHVLRFRYRHGQSIAAVDVQHDVNVGASVSHVHHAVVADFERSLELLEYGDFPISGRHPADGLNLSRGRVEMKARAGNMILGNDAFQRRLDDLLRRRRNHVKRELITLDVVEQLREQPDIRLEPNLLTNLYQVFLSNAAVLRVMQQQIRQLPALLNEMHA